MSGRPVERRGSPAKAVAGAVGILERNKKGMSKLGSVSILPAAEHLHLHVSFSEGHLLLLTCLQFKWIASDMIF